MNANLLPTDRVAVVGQYTPNLVVPSAVHTDWVDMGEFENLLAVISTGDMLSAAFVDAKLQQATDAQGTGMKDVPGKAISTMGASGGDAYKTKLINMRAEELDAENNYTHVRAEVAVSANNVTVAVLLLALDPRYRPLAQADSVIQVIR